MLLVLSCQRHLVRQTLRNCNRITACPKTTLFLKGFKRGSQTIFIVDCSLERLQGSPKNVSYTSRKSKPSCIEKPRLDWSVRKGKIFAKCRPISENVGTMWITRRTWARVLRCSPRYTSSEASSLQFERATRSGAASAARRRGGKSS